MILAKNCMDAVHMLGYPEARILLSQTAIYLATSPKSNASYVAINKAIDLVNKTGDQSVPLHLRNAPTKLMKEIGYGKHYLYAHDHPGNFIAQEFLPESLSGTRIYEPGNNARERRYANSSNVGGKINTDTESIRSFFGLIILFN